jgi:hypothetical protein
MIDAVDCSLVAAARGAQTRSFEVASAVRHVPTAKIW